MPIQEQTIYRPLDQAGVSASYTGTAGTTTAMPAGTQAVRVVCTTDAFVRVGANAATTASVFMPAYQVEYFAANSGDTVSAIQVASAGTVYAQPLN